MVARTIQFLNEVAPNVPYSVKTWKHGTYIELAPAPTADYFFALTPGDSYQATLSVCALGRKSIAWHEDFNDLGDGIVPTEQMLVTARIVILNPTRVVQFKGLISTQFLCQYNLDGAWKDLGRDTVVAPMWMFPKIKGWQKTWQSPALIDAFK